MRPGPILSDGLEEVGALGPGGIAVNGGIGIQVGGKRVSVGQGRRTGLEESLGKRLGLMAANEFRINRSDHGEAIQGFHRSSESGRNLEEIRHPVIRGSIAPRRVKEGRIEEKEIPFRQGQLYSVGFKVIAERRIPKMSVARGESLGEGQKSGGARFNGHVRMGHRSLQGEVLGHGLCRFWKGTDHFVRLETQMIVAVRGLGVASRFDIVHLGGELIMRAQPGPACEGDQPVAIVIDEQMGGLD